MIVPPAGWWGEAVCGTVFWWMRKRMPLTTPRLSAAATLDVLHVAAAKLIGTTDFCTFDTRPIRFGRADRTGRRLSIARADHSVKSQILEKLTFSGLRLRKWLLFTQRSCFSIPARQIPAADSSGR